MAENETKEAPQEAHPAHAHLDELATVADSMGNYAVSLIQPIIEKIRSTLG